MSKASLKIKWAPDRHGQAARTTNEVPIEGENQFIQVQVDGKAIVVMHDDHVFGRHTNGGSMIPLRARQTLMVETLSPYPEPEGAKIVPMKHRSGRIVASIGGNNRQFALA